MKTRDLALSGIIGALYVVLTLAIAPLAYGQIQMRVSEILMILPYYNKKYAPGIIIGCLVANLFSPLGIMDIAFGTLATAISVYIITHIKNKVLATLLISVVGGIIVGIMLNIVFGSPLIISMIYVAVGEALIVTIGFIIFHYLVKNKRIAQLLDI